MIWKQNNMYPKINNLTPVKISNPIIKKVFSPWDESQIGTVECIRKNNVDLKNIKNYYKTEAFKDYKPNLKI